MDMAANLPLFLRNEYLHGPVSLWDASSNRDNGREFFRVEIYSDENDVEKELDIDKILNNVDSHKCHICNVGVPKTYMREHIASVKHETCMKIANIALERTQLHIKSHLISRRIEVVDTYFCQHCSVVVQNIDKDKHTLSNKHQNSVRNDGLLQTLVNVYENLDDEGVIGNILSVKDIELNNILNMADGKENIAELNTEKESVKTEEENNANDNTNSVKGNKDKNEEESKYLKCDMENYNDNQIPQVEDANSAGKVKNYNIIPKIKHAMDKPNPERKIDVGNNKKTVIEINKTMKEGKSERNQVEKQTNIESTSSLEKEACVKEGTSNYSENVPDINCYIEIASFLQNKSTVNIKAHSKDTVYISAPKVEEVQIPLSNFHGYHISGQNVACKICSDTLKPVDGRKHKWNDVHMKNIMSPLQQGHFRQINDKLNHCLLCNSIHSTSQIADHIASEEHANNLQKYRTFKQITKKAAHLAFMNNMEWTHIKVYCKICGIQIEKTDESIKNHVHSQEHIRKRNSLLMVNKIIKVSSMDKFYECLACKKRIWCNHLVSHCKLSQHKKKIIAEA